MGGYGSGRRAGAKATTTDYRTIDVRRWQREGYLAPGRAFTRYWIRNDGEVATLYVQIEPYRVLLRHQLEVAGETAQEAHYAVHLVWTDCNYGGKRPWFLCPAQGCGRRVAILYWGGFFACRHCYELVYESQREAPHDRAARRADKIRAKLGWRLGILNPIGPKPKGMRSETYFRLSMRYFANANEALAGIKEKFGY